MTPTEPVEIERNRRSPTGDPNSLRDRIWYPEPDTDFRDLSGAVGPRKLMFTLTGKCNLRCRHCARGSFAIEAHETPPALVDYVIRELFPVLRAIRLGGTDLGEQMLSRNFDRFLDAVANNSHLHLELITNLTVLDEARAALIARACHEFAISLEGVGEFFERTRGFSWQRFSDHLQLVNEARRRNERSELRIIAIVTCFLDNLGQLPRILELSDSGIDEFRFQHFRPNHEGQVHQCLDVHRAEANRAFEELKRIGRERGLRVETPPPFDLPDLPSTCGQPLRAQDGEGGTPSAAPGLTKRWICHFPFEAASIFSDGKVAPCCEAIDLGRLDLERPDLERLFSSAAWRALREQVLTWNFQGKCVECQFRRGRIVEATTPPSE